MSQMPFFASFPNCAVNWTSLKLIFVTTVCFIHYWGDSEPHARQTWHPALLQSTTCTYVTPVDELYLLNLLFLIFVIILKLIHLHWRKQCSQFVLWQKCSVINWRYDINVCHSPLGENWSISSDCAHWFLL